MLAYFIIGLAVSFNVIIIMWKLSSGRVLNAIIDAICLGFVTVVFSDTYGALVVGTIASVVISVYLLITTPTIGTKHA